MKYALNSRLPLLSLAAFVFLIDRITKHLVLNNIPLWQERPIIPGFFHLCHLENRGAAFSLFTQNPAPWKLGILIGFSVLALCVVLYLLLRSQHSGISATGLALILGGALGNLWDRVIYGRVVDFLDFYLTWHSRRYDWPPFNVADSAIVVGACLLLFELLTTRPSSQISDTP